MPWIDVISPRKATGLLRRQYRAAMDRAGRIWGLVSLMSPNPRALGSSMDLYVALMHKPSPLPRSRRELLAVVVSATNHCVY